MSSYRPCVHGQTLFKLRSRINEKMEAECKANWPPMIFYRVHYLLARFLTRDFCQKLTNRDYCPKLTKRDFCPKLTKRFFAQNSPKESNRRWCPPAALLLMSSSATLVCWWSVASYWTSVTNKNNFSKIFHRTESCFTNNDQMIKFIALCSFHGAPFPVPETLFRNRCPTSSSQSSLSSRS